MSRTRAHRRAYLTRPAAALGVVSLAALGLTVPAAADVVPPDDETTTSATESGDGAAASAEETAPAGGEETPTEGEAADEGVAAEPTEEAEAPAEDAEPAEGAVKEDEPVAEESADEGVVAPLSVEADGTIVIDVLGITDFHGALEQAPAMGGLIDQIRAENEDTVFVSAGDSIGGSTYESAIQDDVPTIEVLNAMGLETSAVGNHEFDRGYDDLANRVEPLADWDYLGANVEGETPDMPAYHVWESPAGVTVGFVGTVTTETPNIVAPDGIVGLSFTDEAATTNTYAAQLSDGNPDNGEADIVIALAHTGATDAFLTALSADVDAVFTGHTHVAVNEDTTIPVLQGGSSGDFLSRMTVTYDPDTEQVTSVVGENIAIDADSATVNTEVQAIVDAALAEAEVLGQEPVGTVDGPLNRGSNTGELDGSNRGVESPLGNFLAEVAQWTALDLGIEADFGIINPGGIRAELDGDGDGVITYAEAFSTQPFGNTIGTIDLTGAQVITMLEQQFQEDEGADRPVLRLGLSDEVRYVYDPEAPEDDKILTVLIDGEPIDEAATYTVASNTFLLAGQDGFTVLAEGTNYVDTGVIDLQGLIDYLEATGEVEVDFSQRSLGVNGPTTLTAGEEVTFELSSLAFTTTEPKPAEVTVQLKGLTMATAEVDATIVPDRDETGRATVTFTVPEEFFGDAVLSVRDGLTAFDLDVTIDGLDPETHSQVDILNITDFHGRIEPNRASAGAAVLAGAVDYYRDLNENTIFVSAGDNIGASTFTSMVQRDNPTIEVLNEMGLFTSAVGNHEFDQGFADLEARIDGTDPELLRTQFSYLGANVYGSDGEPALQESDVFETADGVRVGFIGVVTPLVPSLVTPAGIEGLTFGDMAEAVERVTGDLTDGDDANGEADVIIVLVHDGAESTDIEAVTADTPFGDLVRTAPVEVDAILAGHTHLVYDHQLPVEEWPADLQRPVVQAGQYGEHLGHLSFIWDETAEEVIWLESEVLPLTIDNVPQYPADAEIAAIVAAAAAEAEVAGSVELGEIGADFNRAQNSDGSENRGGESTLGNFVADVQLWATAELDSEIAFMNPGGLRTDLEYDEDAEDGTITYQEAAMVQPFANTLVTMDLTGEQIIQVLEEQWQPEGASRPFLKLGVSETLTYTYNPTAPAGERIVDVWVMGEPLDLAATYKVTVNSFLASGGDNFATFAEGANPTDSGRIDLQAMVDFFAAQDEPVMPDYAQRAVGVVEHTDTDSIETGTEMEIDFSSLLFSTNEPKPSELVVYLDDVELGAFPIDATIVDGTDEVGRATALFTIPDLSGYEDGDIATLMFVAGETVIAWEYVIEGQDGTAPGGDDGDDGTVTPPLPDTGSDVAAYGLAAAGLMVLGGLTLAAAHRRRQLTEVGPAV